MNKDKIAGTGEEAKGALKESVGKLTGNDKLRAAGAAEKAAGKLRSTTGSAKHRLRGLFGK